MAEKYEVEDGAAGIVFMDGAIRCVCNAANSDEVDHVCVAPLNDYVCVGGPIQNPDFPNAEVTDYVTGLGEVFYRGLGDEESNLDFAEFCKRGEERGQEFFENYIMHETAIEKALSETRVFSITTHKFQCFDELPYKSRPEEDDIPF